MNVSYGPPGAKGVTQLMAVGADDLESSPSDRIVRFGGLMSLALLGYGAATGRRGLRNGAAGAAVAFLAVGLATGALGKRTVLVTAPAPAAP